MVGGPERLLQLSPTRLPTEQPDRIHTLNERQRDAAHKSSTRVVKVAVPRASASASKLQRRRYQEGLLQ
jgi:hypothetical protein